MTPVDNLWITLWITGLGLWITLWITCGKPGGVWGLWITGRFSTRYPQGSGGYPQGLSTSPLPSGSRFSPRYPHIHRPYYYDYGFLRSLKRKTRSNSKGGKGE
jgi:hypothetical protein